jgi:4-oxalocrotonate tautomerase
MPVVIIETWKGKTNDQKAKLIEGITKAFKDIGVDSEMLHIIIHDIPKCNWGIKGIQASKSPLQ